MWKVRCEACCYGGASQFVQIIGTLTCFVFIFAISWALLKILHTVQNMRVATEVELGGLDVLEMGIHGYPEVQGPSTIIHELPGGHGNPVGVGVWRPSAARSEAWA